MTAALRRGIAAVMVAAFVPVVASVATATSAHATAPIVVTTTADVVDSGDGVISLREAVAMADAASGADWILLANGATYDLTICGADDDTTPDNAVGDLDVTGSDWLDITPASTSGASATIHQTCPQRILYAPTAGLALGEVNLTGGQGSLGGALRAGGFLTLDHVDQSGASVGAFPGLDAAAVYSTTRPVTIDDSAIHDNASEGLYQGSPDPSAASFHIARSSIRANDPTRDMGAGGVWAAGALTISDSEVVDNGGAKSGPSYPARVGGLCLSCGSGVFGTSTITSSTIERNHGTISGGLTGDFHLVDSAITDNIATFVAGGAGGDFVIERSIVARNSAGLGAGGLWGTGSITDSTIADNATPGIGGGVMTGPRPGHQTLTVTNTTITGNQGQVAGGVLVVNDGNGSTTPGSSWPVDVTISASTVAGNTLVPMTGVSPFSTPDSSDLTFARATSDAPSVPSGSLTMSSSVLGSGGSVTPACTLVAASSVTSGGYSFSGDASCGLGAGAGDVSGGGDPGLSPLADHGGPTPTMAPVAGSPLIDRVPAAFSMCASSFDQRGVARPVGAGCEIGAVEVAGQRFHAVDPVRILDTRPVPQRVGPLGPWTAGATHDVTVVGGLSGVPATATAVVLNVTATGGTANGDYLSVWPAGGSQPTVSSVNVDAAKTVSNQVTVALGTGADAGKVSIFNAGGTQQVIVDVNGYYDGAVDGDGFHPLDPVRVLDSRPVPERVGPLGTWSAGQTQDVTVGGLAGVPVDADAVVLNVTATGGTANGDYLSVWPAGEAQPVVSSLNVDAGRTVPSAVTVKLGTGGSNAGKVSVFNAGGTQDVVIDVVGYFAAGSGASFYPVSPRRLIDSRPPPQRVGPLGPWGENILRQVVVTEPDPGIPVGATALVANLTATGGTHDHDYLTVYPNDTGIPFTSTVNPDAAQTVANAFTTRLSASPLPFGQLVVYNLAGTVNVIIDISGYYA